MPLLSFLEKEDVSLLINIGNGGINVSFVSFVKNQIPKFLYSINAPYVGEKANASKLSDSMNLLLDSLLRIAIKKAWSNAFWSNKNRKFSHVIISFSSPWLILKSKDIHLSQDIPFIITKKFINDVTLKEAGLFKKELLKNAPENTGGGFEIIEKSIIHTKINGYTVDNIIGRKTKSLDVFLYVSAISENIEKKISDIVLEHTHIERERILMHSFPLVLFSTVRDNLEEDPDFILMNINSEITDIILINNRIIKSVESFPFGKNTIVRRLAKFFKVSLEIAESQLTMYMSKKVDDSTFDSMQNLLEDLEKEWSIYLEDALLTLSRDMILPKKIYVVTNNEVSSIFIYFLKLPKTDTTSNFRKHLEIIHMNESILSRFYQNNFKTPVNESLVILATFYNKLIQNQ